MALRIGIAGLRHETNTYVLPHTTTGAFDVRVGSEIEDAFAGTATAIGGMLAAADELGAQVSPLVHADAEPSGTISLATYEELRDAVLAATDASGPLDVLALDLHGAGVAEHVEDIEGDLCERLRAHVPRSTRIVGTLDLHGNITQRMADQLSVALGCREYPHLDLFERGAEVVHLAAQLQRARDNPIVHVESLPLLIGAGPRSSTLGNGPSTVVNELCRALGQRPRILDCTFFHGFVPSDVSFVGASIVCTGLADRKYVRSIAEVAARRVWDLRDEFEHDLPSPYEAVEHALAIRDTPVVINDVADNPGGGAPGDGTELLRALIDLRVDEACFGVLYDPEAVRIACEAGPGATIQVSLGCHAGSIQGGPVQVEAYVKSLNDGQVTLRAMCRGVVVSMGPTARLQVRGVDVIVGTKRAQVLDPGIFESHGIELRSRRLICVKSAVHFRAGFATLGKTIISANGAGLSSARPTDFVRAHTDRPLYPLDRTVGYDPSAQS